MTDDAPKRRPDMHPSRKHDVDLRPQIIVFPPSSVYSDTSGVRRRDRRSKQIAELKANRRARVAPKQDVG